MSPRRPSPSYFDGLPPITAGSYGYSPAGLKRSKQSSTSWSSVLSVLPLVVVVSLLLYPYIPFVYFLSYHATYQQRERPMHALYQLVTFHLLLAMSLWSYFSTYLTHPGSPQQTMIGTTFPLVADEEDAIGMRELAGTEREGDEASEGLLGGRGGGSSGSVAGPGGLRVVMAKATNGGNRFCRKCNVPKPDRTHHCSKCKTCVLKMDHHCVWLSTCIGQKNYRSFLLFLTYTSFYSILVGVEAFRTVWAFFEESDAMTEIDLTPVSHLILLIIGFAFSISIGGFCIYHWILACSNQTTLESMATSRAPPAMALPPSPTHTFSLRWRPDHLLTRSERRGSASSINVFDLGWKRNLRSLSPAQAPRRRFGLPSIVAYVLPSPVVASGLSFETVPDRVEALRAQTRVVRLGEDPFSLENQRARENEDRWGRPPTETDESEVEEGWETSTRRKYSTDL